MANIRRRSFLVGISSLVSGSALAFALDYGEFIPLDAEALAEGGVLVAYQRLLPRLKKLVKAPVAVREKNDHNEPSYRVFSPDREYFIYGGKDQEQSWGRATFALFDIVNRQLEGKAQRLFAINADNDLGGMFLAPAHALAAQKSLPHKNDWPYLPVNQAPWYGRYH